MNRLLNTDSYKHSHFLQYPDGTRNVHSYIAPRGGIYPELVFFGLQLFIIDYLLEPITAREIDEAEEIALAHGVPFNREGWDYILEKYKGRLPVMIRALPEGTLVANKNVLVTIEATDEKCFWLPSFLETALLRAVWYPTDVATTSFRIKRILKGYLEDTGTPELIPFKLHDFGARGVSSNESAGIGGLAHLSSFMGTDTMSALLAARRGYNTKMAGFSIPAAEHSTMTALARAGEARQMQRMIEKFAGEGKIYACVSDGYDIFNATEHIWGGELRDQVIKSGGTLVIRPDSGDPVAVTHRVVEILGEKFGYEVNAKGFKVLHPSVRVIQGDGVNESSINAILQNFKAHGWSADNIAFGMGGALLQAHTRDDNKWAMKASAINIDGVWSDVYKDPVTDQGKKSFRGRLDYVQNLNGRATSEYIAGNPASLMRPVYRNGILLDAEDLTTIRARIDASL